MDIGDDEKENGYAGKKETYTTELGCGTRGGRFLPYGTPAGTAHIHRFNRKRRGKDTQQCVSNPAARTLHDLLDIDRSYNNNGGGCTTIAYQRVRTPASSTFSESGAPQPSQVRVSPGCKSSL